MGRAPAARASPALFRSRYGYLVALALTVLLIAELIPAKGVGNASQGYLDLSQAASKDVISRLNGEWAFYRGRLLLPENFSGPSPPEPDAFARLPSIWTRARHAGAPMPSVGDATYRLEIRHAWMGVEVGVKLMRINSAFELYADGRLIARGGSLPDSP